MDIAHLFFGSNQKDARQTLLYRFHIVLIAINFLAIVIDMSSGRTTNVWIDTGAVILLSLNAWYLRERDDLQKAAYIFLIIVASALFTQIWLSHFGTMSIVFVLLLPLTTMLFIRLSTSMIIEFMMITVMAALLFLEYKNNPSNPIIQNPKALFHLAYAALIIFIFGLLYHFSILKTLKELDASNHQKELLLKEVHHRVKNNLNVIASIIGLQANQLTGREKEQLLKSKTRIESISMVHEMLYKYDNFETIEFESYIRQLSQLLLRMYSKTENVTIHIKTNRKYMPLEIMIQFGMITNELLTNSIKYAFDDQPGNVTIELYNEEKRFQFTYMDDGKGVKEPQHLLKNKSLGIKLIHLSAKQIGATVEIDSHPGLSYIIKGTNERY